MAADPNRCSVCLTPFSDVGGPASCIRNEHHLIPRAYGGVDGPTTMVCSAHHDLLHLIGSRLISGKPYFDLLTHDRRMDQVLLFLASRVQVAEAATRGDPNKKVLLPLTLDGVTQQKLVRLARIHRVSRADLIRLLIEREYVTMFPMK